MSDFQVELDLLRQRMAAAALRADQRVAPPITKRTPPVETDALPGAEARTAAGCHWQADQLLPRHGATDMTDLCSLPHDLFDGISEAEIPGSPPDSWRFLDTETTGLAGGSGTCAFLIGVGRITPRGFEVRQFFMRDYDEEPSVLEALEQELDGARTLVTYNGKTFDLPLLETRFRMNRRRSPFSRIPHLDLLHGARRLWRLRFESCRLVELENNILRFSRGEDVPGEMIPYLYFEYLRSRSPHRLAPVFLHNALDIVSLACLSAVVPWAFRDPAQATLLHGAELISLGRWCRTAGKLDQALELFRRGVARAISDDLLFRTLWDIGAIEKKLGRQDAAIAVYTDLATCRNPHRVAALEELAKHYEHRERNYGMALEFTETALALAETEALRKRQGRLVKRRQNGSGRHLAPVPE